MAKQKRYATHITTANGTRVYVSARTKSELDRKVLEAKLAMHTGVDITCDYTFDDYAKLWLKVYKSPPNVSEHSYLLIEANLRNHVLPVFSGIKLRDVRAMHIQMFIDTMDGYSRSLQSKCMQIVKGIFTSAVEDGLITKSPISSKHKLTGTPTEEAEPLTNEQVLDLLACLQGRRPYLFVLLALTTGMRRGEILGLLWDDVDFDSNTIHVRHNLAYACNSNHAEVSDKLKTPSSYRDIPMSPVLRDYLLQQDRTTKTVVHDASGQPLSKASFRSMWDTVNRRAPEGVECHPHLLRHTFTTQCIESGMDPTEVQHLLGHKSIDVTMNIYNHYREKCRKEETAKRLHGTLSYLA